MSSRHRMFEQLERRLLLDSQVLISELMAINDSTLPDGDGEFSDWLEIHNPGAEAVDLTGWQLKDSGNTWPFPSISLGPGEFRVIFASDGRQTVQNPVDPYVDPEGNLHTNFKLAGDGEYLALLDATGTVVHEYDEYPAQTADISYGIGQNVETTQFVAPGDSARYLVPTEDPGDWTAVGFDDSQWATGDTALGFANLVPGLAVRNIKASVSVGHLDTAFQVLNNPGMQSYVNSENIDVLNYFNSGGRGHYGNDAPFPGFTGAMDDFVVEATGFVAIPAGGAWTFGVNSDDGFSLELDDGTNHFSMSYPTPRAPADTFATFDIPEAGTYSLRLVFYERGGGSCVELFAAQGTYSSFDAGAFDLVGDTANGGLGVQSEPVSGGGGGGAGFSGLIETDVQDEMKGINASMFVRLPFTVADPAQIESLTLKMKYDDGYVAHLNGHEVARQNAPDTPAWDSNATAERTDAQATAWENVSLSDHLDKLGAGGNVLCVHAMNYATDDGDFLVLPELAEVTYLGLGEHFFATATPGEANTAEHWLHVEDTEFSLDRGFYERLPEGEYYSLEITTDTPGATIHYTLDGSTPSQTHGIEYTGAIQFNETTVVRAMAFKDNHAPTNVDTQTYLFFDDVIRQPTNPDGFPAAWGGTTADYQMDPDVVNNPLYSDRLEEALLSLPTVSIVTDVDNLFGPSGIYTNPTAEGVAWERPTSVEWIDPQGTAEFQVDAGLRIYGGAFRGMGLTRKKTFRLLFKADYGPTKLDFPLFHAEGAVTSFDTIILRAGANDGWNNWGKANTQYIIDEFMRRTQLALGEPSAHGTFVHLYLNGLYWGLYNATERPESSFCATYFDGDKEEWDALNSGAPTGESNTATWNAMLAQVRAGLSDMASYQKIQGNNPDGTNNPAYDDLLDVDNYIDYLFSNFWGGTGDWPHHNWYVGCRRPPDSTGFKFFNWDSEGAIIVWSNLNANVTGVNSSVAEPYAALRQNEEFRMLFADHAHRHLFNNGPATAEASYARYEDLANLVELAIIAESARWGDQASSAPYTLAHWEAARDYVLNTYMPQRPAIVLNQLKAAGLYPNVVAPSFDINESYQHGGTVDLGDLLTIEAPAGTIYYTTDGTDPRMLGGGLSPAANGYGGAIALHEGTHVKARVLDGGEWSALNEATFYIDLAPDIRITEIMYNPADPTQDEIDAGYADNDDFEFIEIRNISATDTLPLEGLRFSDGIDFTFPRMSLAPGQYAVAVKNEAAFRHRYPGFAGAAAGEYVGSLNNAGERLRLDAPVGGVIHQFCYNDGWYGHTDGDGFSLTIRDAAEPAELWAQQEGWRASAAPGGSPGTDDVLVTPGSIVISEVLAHSDAPFVDCIELHNTADSPIDLSGWFLSDQKADELGNGMLRKYQIPSLPPIEAGGYLALYEDEHFGAAFSLSELGDDVYLSSNADGAAGGYREHVDFGASPRNVSIGLHTKSTGGTDFTLLRAHSFGSANAEPYFEDLVINEVMYHPVDPTEDEAAAGFTNGDDFEFVEIYNTSPHTTHTLRNFHVGNGIGFTFGWCNAEADRNEAWTLEPGATATWTASLPAGLDTYKVFARWDLLDPEGNQRDLDGQARYLVTHADGSTEVVRDQKPEEDDEGPDYMDPDGWVSLGTYDFDGSGQVVLTRGTNDPDNWTIADQVKFVSAAHTEIAEEPLLDSWCTANGPATIAPGEYVVIVHDHDAFDQRYDIAGSGISVAGQYTGNLANNGEKVKLFRAGDPEPSGFIPYYRIDYVNYGDRLPWPTEPDGSGCSLSRLGGASGEQYGNDPASWEAGPYLGTPGAPNRANHPPVAADDVKTTDEDTALAFSAAELTANDTDADGDVLTVTAVAATADTHGTVGLAGGTITYVPAADYHGPASFEYTIRDGYGGTDTAAVSVTVHPVNDPPVATGDAKTTDEDTALAFSADGLTANDTATGDTHGTVGLAGGTVTYVPAADYQGPASFDYTIGDGYGGTDTGAVSVTVDPVNDPPAAADDAYVTDEDTHLALAAPGVLADDTDLDGDLLTAVLESGPGHGTLTLHASGSFTYTPDGDFNGIDSFTYRASDSRAHSEAATVTVTVNPVNDAPAASGEAYQTDEDVQIDVAAPGVLANDADVDGDALAAVLVGGAANGTVILRDDGSFTYTPGANFHGTDSFRYTASDTQAGSDEVTVTVTVRPVNDEPVANDDAYACGEDSILAVEGDGGLLPNDSDTDGDTLTAVLIDQPGSGSLVLDADGSFVYTPNTDFHGIDSFTYRAYDGHAHSALATVTVMVGSDNDVPAAVGDAYEVYEDQILHVAAAGVLANDSDADGDPLTAVLDYEPTHGTLALLPNGAFTYTPAANFHGTDTFRYRAYDGEACSGLAAVTLTVHPVNDDPVAAADAYATDEDLRLTVLPPGILGNDSDTDGDVVTAVLVSGPGSGTLGLDADGAFIYTPNDNFHGTDRFTYRANDSRADSNVATVTITVDPVNDLPVADDDAGATDEDTALAFSAADLTANDTDVDGDALTVTAVAATADTHGTVGLAGGTVTYVPAAHYHGTASFEYTVGDGYGGTDTATVSVTVRSVNDPPVASDDTYVTAEDTELVVPAPGVLANDGDADGPGAPGLTARPIGGPTCGAVTLNADGSFTYAPLPNMFGTDSFGYVASDGAADSNVAMVTITVDPVNDVPAASAGDDREVVDTDGDGYVAVRLNAADSSDMEGIAFYRWSRSGVRIASGPGPIHDVALGIGRHRITLTVVDGAGAMASDEVVIDVLPPPGAGGPAILANPVEPEVHQRGWDYRLLWTGGSQTSPRLWACGPLGLRLIASDVPPGQRHHDWGIGEAPAGWYTFISQTADGGPATFSHSPGWVQLVEPSATLYDGALGSLPGQQGWLYGTDPPVEAQATQTPTASGVILDSRAAMSEAAGYFSSDPLLGMIEHPTMPVLDRLAGYCVQFTLRVDQEDHASGDRAGLSVIALSQDRMGIELGFWQDEIWAQSGPGFVHAEGTTFDTTARLTRYELRVLGDHYSLWAGGGQILYGSLRDYSLHPHPVYSQPSFLFLGDDTSSAAARIELAGVSVGRW